MGEIARNKIIASIKRNRLRSMALVYLSYGTHPLYLSFKRVFHQIYSVLPKKPDGHFNHYDVSLDFK